MTDVSFPVVTSFQFTDETGRLITLQSPVFHRFLQGLWERTGGDNDDIEDLEVGELYESGIESGNVIELENNLESYDFIQITPDELKFPIFTSGTTHITTGNEIVICDQKATITLNPNPSDDERVYIKNTTHSFIADAGAKKIDGQSKLSINRNYFCALLVYSVELDGWSII